ncbi:MAG: hypothetical protein AAGD14_06025 [Planctomycetota bacterium]
MRTAIGFALIATLLASPKALAQEGELIKYSVVEIENLLANFKATYKNKKAPEEDVDDVLTGLTDAYKYLASKEPEDLTKEEEKAQKAIVSMVAKGLKARKRARVNVQCAIALGKMGDKAGAKPLLKWLDGTVFDMKNPNSGWVEYGMQSLAWIGPTDSKSLDFLRSYATGKHNDTNVAAQCLMATFEWRMMPGKSRKEMFNKIQQYMGGLYSQMRGSDAKKRGEAEQKYNTIKENGLKALHLLSGNDKPFADPDEAFAWWKDNKKGKWPDYENPRFKKKTP